MNSTNRSSADPWRFPAGTPGSAGSRAGDAQRGRTGGSLLSPPAISLPKDVGHQGDGRKAFGQPRRRHRLAERQDGQGTGAEIVRESKEVIT
jgi:hypothetical protein